MMGAGRMTLSEDGFLNYRMIEKNPALYLENPEIRRYMRMLAEESGAGCSAAVPGMW